MEHPKNDLRAVHQQLSEAEEPMAFIVSGDPRNLHVYGEHTIVGHAFRRLQVYPGSWNPVHAGHLALARAHHSMYPETTLLWELSIRRRGKEYLEYEEMERRYLQFYTPMLFTNAVYFRDKIRALENSLNEKKPTFHLGLDVAVRVLQDHTLEEIEAYEAVFGCWVRGDLSEDDLVAVHGRMPKNFEICQTRLPESVRYISSTQVREQKGRGLVPGVIF